LTALSILVITIMISTIFDTLEKLLMIWRFHEWMNVMPLLGFYWDALIFA